MANLPAGIGYLTVTDNAFNARSDSSDAGDIPDITQAEALVLISPVGIPAERPYLIAAASGQRIHVEPVSCFLANGQLYRAADGSAPLDGETPTTLGVTLLAPDQGALDLQNWYWRADYRPANGSKWGAYSINFTGKSGDTVVMAQAALVQDILNINATVRQALAFYVTPANPANPPLVSDVPAQARIGDTLVDISKTPWYAYKIGA